MKRVLQFTIIWFILGGSYLFGLPLKYSLLTKDGSGEVVSAVVYINRVVAQGGGTINYAAGTKKVLEQIKIPAYYQKKQKLGDVVANFCNLYRVVGYQFKGSVLNILLVGKDEYKSEPLEDYRIDKGDLLFGFGGQANFYQADLDVGGLSVEFSIDSGVLPITMGSIEFMLSDHWGIAFSYATFGVSYVIDSGVSNLEGWYHFFNLMVNYHFDLGRFNCFVGAGVSPYSIDWKPEGVSIPDAKGVGEHNFAVSFAAGSYFRLYKQLYLGARFIFGMPGILGLSGGVYVKL